MEKVHIWIGTFESEALFLDYLKDTSQNKFSIDQKVKFYDEDWIECFYNVEIGINDLIKKLSYSRSFQEAAIESATAYQSGNPNSVIMIDANEIKKPLSANGKGYTLHYLGEYPGDVPISNNKKEIDLRSQNLTEIPIFVFENPDLTFLELYDNQITELPDQLFQMTELTYLGLTQNKIKYLPSQFNKLEKLETLQVSKNEISQIESGLFDLQNLRLFNLNTNKLNCLPDEIGKLTKLQNLMLQRNNLESIPNTVNNLESLEQLDLRHNHFTEIPKNIKYPDKITYLNI